VLGDGVNLAARLESADQQSIRTYSSRTVVKLTSEHFYLSHGGLADGGRAKPRPVEVFSVFKRQLAAATRVAGNVSWSGQTLPRPEISRRPPPGLNPPGRKSAGWIFLCTMYRLRCSAYEQKPPPDDWDGSFALAEK